ncbi:MAG: hypothetical protein ACYS80_04055 [Planctomycetota bacterium]|jgi:hypothetical protein
MRLELPITETLNHQVLDYFISWLDTNCASPDWYDSAYVDKSYAVDMTELAILTENWLETCCLD